MVKDADTVNFKDMKKYAEGLFKSLSIGMTATNQNIFLNSKENKQHLYKMDSTFKRSTEKLEKLNSEMRSTLDASKFAGVENEIERTRNTTAESFDRLEKAMGLLLKAIKQSGSGGTGGSGVIPPFIPLGVPKRIPGLGNGRPQIETKPRIGGASSESRIGSSRPGITRSNGERVEPKVRFGNNEAPGERIVPRSDPKLGSGRPTGPDRVTSYNPAQERSRPIENRATPLDNIRPGDQRGPFKGGRENNYIPREPKLFTSRGPNVVGDMRPNNMGPYKPGKAPMAPRMDPRLPRGDSSPHSRGPQVQVGRPATITPGSLREQIAKGPKASVKGAILGHAGRGVAYTNPVTGTIQATADIAAATKTVAGRTVARVLMGRLAGAVGILLSDSNPAGESAATEVEMALTNYARDPANPLSKSSVKNALKRAKSDYTPETYQHFLKVVSTTELAGDSEIRPFLEQQIKDFNLENRKVTTGARGGTRSVPGLTVPNMPHYPSRADHEAGDEKDAYGADGNIVTADSSIWSSLSPSLQANKSEILGGGKRGTGKISAATLQVVDAVFREAERNGDKMYVAVGGGSNRHSANHGDIQSGIGESIDIKPVGGWKSDEQRKKYAEYAMSKGATRIGYPHDWHGLHIQVPGPKSAGGTGRPTAMWAYGGNKPKDLLAKLGKGGAAPSYTGGSSTQVASTPTSQPSGSYSGSAGSEALTGSDMSGGGTISPAGNVTGGSLAGMNSGNPFNSLIASLFGGLGSGGPGGLFGSIFSMLGNIGGGLGSKFASLDSNQGKSALLQSVTGAFQKHVGHDPQHAAAFETSHRSDSHNNNDTAMNAPIHIGSPKSKDKGNRAVNDKKNQLQTFTQLENIFNAHTEHFVNRHIYSSNKRPDSVGRIS